MSKHNVALIFGGCTPEHEVSIVTAHQVFALAFTKKTSCHPKFNVTKQRIG